MSKQLRIYKEGDFDYQILWEEDFTHLPGSIQSLNKEYHRLCIVSDSNVSSLYAEEIRNQLNTAGWETDLFVFPAGEASKNLDTVKELYGFLMEHHYTRKDALVALGGGVTGDLSGFAAATFLRGIDFIQVPTSLLAQVDSSVGGKTGVDLGQYKNMVGAFYQPQLVYMNSTVLKSLPEEQFQSGMGEVLKTGLIRDSRFYEWTINHMWEIQDRIPAVLSKMVRTCCQIKASVVQQDPKEQGERAILNLGHTIGHGIETLTGLTLPHGHCVALGTIAAAFISFQRGMLSTEEFYEIRDMNVGFDLPIFFKGLKTEDILAATKSDKKMENGKIRFILLNKIGQAVIDTSVTDEEMTAAINFINGDLIDGE